MTLRLKERVKGMLGLDVKVKVKVKVKLVEVEEEDFDLYNSKGCPNCEKGIVSIGKVAEVIFPKGILASDNIGEIKFYHYTCDRCEYKILTTIPF